jgi:hypothetical protein
MIKNLEQYPIVNESLWDKAGLEQFEKKIANLNLFLFIRS